MSGEVYQVGRQFRDTGKNKSSKHGHSELFPYIAEQMLHTLYQVVLTKINTLLLKISIQCAQNMFIQNTLLCKRRLRKSFPEMRHYWDLRRCLVGYQCTTGFVVTLRLYLMGRLCSSYELVLTYTQLPQSRFLCS